MQVRCYRCMEVYDKDQGPCPNCGQKPSSDAGQQPLKPGTLLHGRYQIGKVLGTGSLGPTYLGWDTQTMQKITVKECAPTLDLRVGSLLDEGDHHQGPEAILERLGRLVELGEQPGVTRVLDTFQENGSVFGVMEYLEGRNLSQEDKFGAQEAVELILPVLEGLKAVHDAGLIHGAINPEHLFLTKTGELKLTGFSAIADLVQIGEGKSNPVTAAGYSPVEQYRRPEQQGTHTDVYAISAVLYRMVTGTAPASATDRNRAAKQKKPDPLVRPGKLCKIPKNQENAILNGMNGKIKERTRTVGTLKQELTQKKHVALLAPTGKAGPGKKIAVAAVCLGLAVAIAVPMLRGTGVYTAIKNTLMSFSLSSNEARVPDLRSYSVDVAQDQLEALGLQLKIVGTVHSDTIPVNTIAAQSIAPGEVVPKGSIIEVYVCIDAPDDASGGETIPVGVTEPDSDATAPTDGTDPTEGTQPTQAQSFAMPNVMYKLEKDALALLESRGLTVKVQYVYSTVVAEGLVASQTPEAGITVQTGTRVTLQVSLGENPNQADPTPDAVTLGKERYDLYVGDSVTIQAKGGTGSYTYASSDSSVVTVDAKGKLTAVGNGNATITVSSGNAQSATCAVSVRSYQMSVSPSSLTLYEGASATLTVSGIPSSAKVSWSSDYKAAVKVDSNGTITALKSGSATITAEWKNGTKTYTAHCSVTVQTGGISLDTYKISDFYVGERRIITATTSPAGKTVTWSSSNTAVATVSGGTVTAVGAGSCTITASFDGFSQSCQVTVTQPGISLNKDSLSLYPGNTASLSAAVTPSGSVVEWSSSNTAVATVSGGTVTAVASGSATIRAKMTYGGTTYEASCAVTVSSYGITLSQSAVSMMPGDSKTLSVTTSPSGQSVTWSSSNTAVATVSGGTITAQAEGSATITASMTVNGSTYQATCAVTVIQPSITISSSATNIEFSQRDNKTVSLTADVDPDGGSVAWSSSDTGVATVSGSGTSAVVTALSSGSTTITATYTVNGVSVSDSITLTFQKAASTLAVTSLSYPSSGTFDSFSMSGTVSSNYALTRISANGVAYSPAADRSISQTADDYVFGDDVYEFEASVAATYFLGQFRSLYNTFVSLADSMGLDKTMNLTVNCTGYDSSGASISFTFSYTLTG